MSYTSAATYLFTFTARRRCFTLCDRMWFFDIYWRIYYSHIYIYIYIFIHKNSYVHTYTRYIYQTCIINYWYNSKHNTCTVAPRFLSSISCFVIFVFFFYATAVALCMRLRNTVDFFSRLLWLLTKRYFIKISHERCTRRIVGVAARFGFR